MIVEADVMEWIYRQVEAQGTVDQDMGSLEKAVERVTLEVRCRVLERLTQEAADREVFGCPNCGEMLYVAAHRRWRTVDSSFGAIRFRRSYGLCSHCGRYCIPPRSAIREHAKPTGAAECEATEASPPVPAAGPAGAKALPKPKRPRRKSSLPEPAISPKEPSLPQDLGSVEMDPSAEWLDHLDTLMKENEDLKRQGEIMKLGRERLDAALRGEDHEIAKLEHRTAGLTRDRDDACTRANQSECRLQALQHMERLPRSLGEAVVMIEQLQAGRVVFTDAAKRSASDDGQTLSIEPHAKCGNSRKPLRVHFAPYAQKRVIVIGHCGEHLLNYTSKTGSL